MRSSKAVIAIAALLATQACVPPRSVHSVDPVVGLGAGIMSPHAADLGAPTAPSFAEPRRGTSQCAVYAPEAGEVTAAGAERWSILVGDQAHPSREIHLELDAARRVTGIVEYEYRGFIPEGGSLATGAAVFGADTSAGLFIVSRKDEAAPGAGPAAGTAAVATQQRDLTAEELGRARTLAATLLRRGCGAPTALTGTRG